MHIPLAELLQKLHLGFFPVSEKHVENVRFEFARDYLVHSRMVEIKVVAAWKMKVIMPIQDFHLESKEGRML